MLKDRARIFSQNRLETNTTSLEGAAAVNLVQDGSRLITMCQGLLQIHEYFFQSDDSEVDGPISDLVLEHERFSMEISAIRASSLEDLKLKTKVLSALLRVDFGLERLGLFLNSFILDFDFLIGSPNGKILSVEEGGTARGIVLDDGAAALNGKTFSTAIEEFWLAWSGLNQICSHDELPESGGEDGLTQTVFEYWSTLEGLISIFAKTEGMTLRQIIWKRQVLEVCFSSGVAFMNAGNLTESFLADCERLVTDRHGLLTLGV